MAAAAIPLGAAAIQLAEQYGPEVVKFAMRTLYPQIRGAVLWVEHHLGIKDNQQKYDMVYDQTANLAAALFKSAILTHQLDSSQIASFVESVVQGLKASGDLPSSKSAVEGGAQTITITGNFSVIPGK